MGKNIMLLNGPSGSGKSTMARALQKLIEEKRHERYEIVSIDDFLEMSADSPIYEDDVFEISGEMCEKASELLKTAPGVVIDHVITSERIFLQLREMLRQYPLFSVHVTCSLEELRKRESARGDRCPGSAEASYEYLYPQDGYDLTVDTHVMTPVECAEKILRVNAVPGPYLSEGSAAAQKGDENL